MGITEKKKKELYNFYLENGFNHSVSTISKALSISDKTFFNRYVNKSSSVEIAWDYWQELIARKWTEVRLNCNNAIEELVVFLYVIKQSKAEETHYYYYSLKNSKFLHNDSFFKKTIKSIILRCKQKFYVHEHLNSDIFTDFLLNNIFFIDAEIDKRPEFLEYVLSAALTERGRELFKETPFANH